MVLSCQYIAFFPSLFISSHSCGSLSSRIVTWLYCILISPYCTLAALLLPAVQGESLFALLAIGLACPACLGMVLGRLPCRGAFKLTANCMSLKLLIWFLPIDVILLRSACLAYDAHMPSDVLHIQCHALVTNGLFWVQCSGVLVHLPPRCPTVSSSALISLGTFCFLVLWRVPLVHIYIYISMAVSTLFLQKDFETDAYHGKV